MTYSQWIFLYMFVTLHKMKRLITSELLVLLCVHHQYTAGVSTTSKQSGESFIISGNEARPPGKYGYQGIVLTFYS